jgi:hypothetical protein
VARFLCADAAVGHRWLSAWLADPDPRVRLRAWVAAAWRAGLPIQRPFTDDPEVGELLRPIVFTQIGMPIFGEGLPAPLQQAPRVTLTPA